MKFIGLIVLIELDRNSNDLNKNDYDPEFLSAWL